MTNLPILYSFVRCPYAMRARMALAYNNIKCYLREVDLKNKPQELLIISPKATVPVLQLSNGEVLEQSLDIVYYAFKQNDYLSLSDLDKNRPIINELINKNDTIFIPLLNKYKYFTRYPEETQEYYREQAQKLFLQGMNIRLEQTSYLVDDKISVVDIAILPFIRQFALVDEERFYKSNYKYLIKWLLKFTGNSIFEMIMLKNTPWQAGDEEIVFPTTKPYS